MSKKPQTRGAHMSTTTTGPLNTETRPGCPDWCRGHYPHDSAIAPHVSAFAYTAAATSREVSAITVSLTLSKGDQGPQVMVMTHSLNDDPTSVHLEIDEAERWATILDAAGAVHLAAGIRETLALVQS